MTTKLHARRARTAIGLAALVLATGCRTASNDRPPEDEIAGVRRSLDALYEAFCFEPGGEADWDGMRALFCEGASFVAPFGPGRTPRAVGADKFLEDFQSWVRHSSIGTTGFHERITHARIDAYGGVAHAWVVFDGFVPTTGVEAAGGVEAARKQDSRGIDLIQFVKHGDRWLLASFATQYSSKSLPIPARFERPGDVYAAGGR